MEEKTPKNVLTANKKVSLPAKSQGNSVMQKKILPKKPAQNKASAINTNKNINSTNADILTKPENSVEEKNNTQDILSEYQNVVKSTKKKRKKVKKQRTLYAIFGIISDIFIYPIIIISLIACIAMYTSKSENVIPPVFGYSFVKVLSGSMVKSGFEINEIVIINQNQKDNVGKDDIVAFYYPVKKIAGKSSLKKVDEITNRSNISFTYKVDGVEETINRSGKEYELDKETLTKKARIYFHHILNIYVDTEDGIIYYETKGSSNASADTYLIREDLIIGKYANTPKFIRAALTFCSTSTGMIILVVIPLSILVLLELLNLIEQIGNIMTEKKVLKLKMRFDCEEAIKANVAIELSDLNKIYLYDIVSPNDKPLLYDMQWGYMEDLKLSKKQKEYLSNVKQSLKIYTYEDSTNYWNFWDSNIKGKRKHAKLLDLRNEAIAMKFTQDNLEKDTNGTINEKR